MIEATDDKIQRGRTVRVHRFSSEAIGRKALPTGHHRDHTCELSLCVNDDHIEIITHAENQRRKVERRKARGLRP